MTYTQHLYIITCNILYAMIYCIQRQRKSQQINNMKNITNDLIQEALNEYINGQVGSDRPFSNGVTDEYGNIPLKEDLYTDENGDVWFKLNYENDQRYISLCSKLECARTVVVYFDYIKSKNAIK